MKTIEAIGFAVSVSIVLVLMSMATAGLWYCFDDALAELVGVPALGHLSFWNVWPACLFLSWTFKATLTTKKD